MKKPAKCGGDSACWGEVTHLVNLTSEGIRIPMCPACAWRYLCRGWMIDTIRYNES